MQELRLVTACMYLAEDAAKVDQYMYAGVGDVGGMDGLERQLFGSKGARPRDGLNYMFVCRVVLGCHVRTQDGLDCLDPGVTTSGDLWATRKRRELADINCLAPVPYYSLLVELGQTIDHFREILVFNGARVYPEYLVAYSRESV